jgi:uncharacterized protein (DUF1330 family)
MSCYFVAQIRIHDPQEYQRYLDGFDQIFADYRGKVVAVDDSPTVLEGNWPCTRAVVIRFPNEDEASPHSSPAFVAKRRSGRWLQGLRPRPPEAYPERGVYAERSRSIEEADGA